MRLNLDLTAERARQLFNYNPCTGTIVRRRDNKKMGTPTRGTHSYSHLHVDGKIYMCHRVAWLISYRKWPKLYLDHVDGDTSNNCLWNLREANGSQNRTNSTSKKNSKRPYKGVEVRDYKGKVAYHANIAHEGKRFLIGIFKTAEEARDAYNKAAEELHGPYRRAA